MPDISDLFPAKASHRCLALWLATTVIGSSFAIASWTYHIDGTVRIIANASYIAAIPGWVVIYALGFLSVRDQPLGIIAANGLAWLIWIGVFMTAVRMRSKWVHRPDHDSDQSQPDPSRRAFLCNAAIGVTTVGAVATPGYAALIEPWTIKIRRYTIPINNLDPSLEGLKLVQLADTHLGPLIPESFIKQAVDLVIAHNPDLVLLTGDHVQDGTREIDQAARLCKPLVENASIGVVGVLGNHDWWGDGDRMSSALTNQGIHMIDNDRVWIDPKTRSITAQDPGTGSLPIVGLGDLTDDYVDPTHAFRDIAPHTPAIVLAHNPDTAELDSLTDAHAPNIALMCSGHTHGGQVRIPLLGTPMIPSKFGSKYAGGLVDGPRFPVHISRGIGMSILPVRIGVPPEISVITLTRS